MKETKISKQQFGGIIFFQTMIQAELNHFYINEIGCELWLGQGGCQIFKHGNMLFGFCQHDQVDDLGMITFFYSSKEEVDKMYLKFKDIAAAEPKDNPLLGFIIFMQKIPKEEILSYSTSGIIKSYINFILTSFRNLSSSVSAILRTTVLLISSSIGKLGS